MPVITPNIPEGLIDLMKTFAKCVLKEKPENIYEFSVVHFEKLLQERDGSLNKGYERFAASEKYLDAREKCLMSRITSHLNKKAIPDPLKIPANDDNANVPISETLSPKSLQNKFRPRKLSSRKASEGLLSIKEEDEGHNPSEELAIQHAKLTAARRIQRAYKSYRKRKEKRENGAALIIQRTLKKLFRNKLGSPKALQNDGESTCSNIQNDSGVESDVPKDETEAEHENRKELNVGVKKYMDSDLAINSIITQQVPSFTEDECRSPNLETDKVEEPSVGNLDEADTVVQKEKSVDSEFSGHMGSNIQSSPSKQVEIEETQLNDESGCTEDIEEVDATKDSNLKLDQDHITNEEEVKPEILKDAEEPIKTGAVEAGKSILESEGRFVSNDTNNIGSAELVSDVHYEKGDDIENKANGFPEAILEEVARNGSENDISKETIEFVKSPRENENGKQNTEENSNNDKNGGKKDVENDCNNDNGNKQEEREEKSPTCVGSKDALNDIEEYQPRLNLTENENKKISQDNIQKGIGTITNNEEKSQDLQKNPSNNQIGVNETKNNNDKSKDESKENEGSITPKSVWYVGSEPIITSKSSESIDNNSNEESELKKEGQENNSTINEGLKSNPDSDNVNSANEKIENCGNNTNQENHDINIKNDFEFPIEESHEAKIEKVKSDELMSDVTNKNEENAEALHNEKSSKDVGSDKIVADEINNEENTGCKHAGADEGKKDFIIPLATENSMKNFKNEQKQEISGKDNVADEVLAETQYKEISKHKDDEGEKSHIIPEAVEKSIESIKNEEDKEEESSEKETSEGHAETFKNEENQEISEKDIGPDNNVANENTIELRNDEISGRKYAKDSEEYQTISETAERNTENFENEQQISAETGSAKNIKDAIKIQTEEISGSKNAETCEHKKDQNIPATIDENLENIKNDEGKEEEIGKYIGSEEDNSTDENATTIHNEEINTSQADDGDKNSNIPTTTESNKEILKNTEEKEEDLNKKNFEEAPESTNDCESEKASQEELKNLIGEGKEAHKNEFHIAQGKSDNLEELVNKTEKKESTDETKDEKGNQENINNNKGSINEENLPSEDNKNEAPKDLREETGEQHETDINRAEVIEEEIKKVVAPLRYSSPCKNSIKSGGENNAAEEYEDLEASEDKIIAKELLQHASVEAADVLLKEEQKNSEEQAEDNEKTETGNLRAENKVDPNVLTESNSEGLLTNHLKNDGTLENRSTVSSGTNEYNKSVEANEEKVTESKRPSNSNRNSGGETDKADIKKQESESFNSDLPSIGNDVPLIEINENTNGTDDKKLIDNVLESNKLEKNGIWKFDMKEDKTRKQKEERAFEGFILEPAFKDNDGGNTKINPDQNSTNDLTGTSEAVAANEKEEASSSQTNEPESQSIEISLPEDDKQYDTHTEDNEIVKHLQEDKKAESCEKKLDVDPSKDDNKHENMSERREEGNFFDMQAQKEEQNEDFVASAGESNNIMENNNSEKVDKDVLIKSNEPNNKIQEQDENVDEKQIKLQKDSEKNSGGENAETNDLKNENNFELRDDNKKLSISLETNEDGSPSCDNEVNNKDKNDIANINKQNYEREGLNPSEQKAGDVENRTKINLDAVNKVTADDKLPIGDEEEAGNLKKAEDVDEKKEESLKGDEENNFENTKEILKTSNEKNELKTIDKPELERILDKIELEKLNVDQKSETIRELTENENEENKHVNDEEDTQFSQNTAEETKENFGQNVGMKLEAEDAEKETRTTHSLDKVEIVGTPLEKIDEQQDISVKNSEEIPEDVKGDTVNKVNKDEEKGENKRNQIKDIQDINSIENLSADPSQRNTENFTSGTDEDSGMEKNMENNNIQRNLKEVQNGANGVKDQNQSKTNNQEPISDETDSNQEEAILSDPVEPPTYKIKKNIDDMDKNNDNKNILENITDQYKSIEHSDEEVVMLKKKDKNFSKNENILKEVEKDEDGENSKEDEDKDSTLEENEQSDSNIKLNRTYTISKNPSEEVLDNNEENPMLKMQTYSSPLLNAPPSSETLADNNNQELTEKLQGKEMEEEVQEEEVTKHVIPHATISEAHSAHLLDAKKNRSQETSGALNVLSNETSAKNESSIEKSESKETKVETNEELTAEQLARSSEISSAPLSDAETTRAESRSTINDELSEIENIDISTYGEDSLEAMYYSLRKNEIMLDRMQKRASERKSASREREPLEKLDLRQVKSMSEMGRNMSANSDDDIIIKRLERNESSANDIHQFNNPISVVAQNTSRLLEAMHQINSTPVKPSSSSFEEDRAVRPSCRIYSPSIRMKSRIPTPIKDFPKSVSFETPLAVAQRKSQKFMQRLHNDSQSSENLDSVLDQKGTSDTIRQKMLAYSVSEADSDYCAEAEKKMRIMYDDSNVSTALETASTDTDSTIVSAATKIQAGARGFLTRRRLRRASDGALPQESERKASFGNEAIGESLEDLVEQNAASKIQKSYRRYLGTKQHKSESSKPSPETSSSSKSSDGSKPVGITQVKIGQKRDRDDSDDAKKADDIDDGYHGAYFEGLNLAERRMTLQRGDAVQKYSTPEEENGFSLANDQRVSDAGDSKPKTSPKKRKPVKNDTWRNFGLRQRTMPVQIESDILRVIPKHMRKRIKSADAQKKTRHVMQ